MFVYEQDHRSGCMLLKHFISVCHRIVYINVFDQVIFATFILMPLLQRINLKKKNWKSKVEPKTEQAVSLSGFHHLVNVYRNIKLKFSEHLKCNF